MKDDEFSPILLLQLRPSFVVRMDVFFCGHWARLFDRSLTHSSSADNVVKDHY